MIRSLICTAAFFLPAAIVLAEDVTLDKVKSKTPAAWKSQPPSNKFRAYQFAVPKAKGTLKPGIVK